MRRFYSVMAFLLGLGAVSCDGGTSTDGPSNMGGSTDPLQRIYAKSTSQLQLEVDYQTGAEPYTGLLVSMDTWDLFKANATALFNNQKSLSVPTTLAQMESLSDISGQNFTVEQILAIAKSHRNTMDTAQSASFYVLFLKGYYHDGKQERTDVLGVSLGKTGVIAMFKPVIDNTSFSPKIRRFVEQSTLIHEFGHAIGLVNNGVEMVVPHQDTANGAHDSNSKCVMYYANEGASAAAQYVQQYLVTGNEVLFDSQCLSDVSARISSAK